MGQTLSADVREIIEELNADGGGSGRRWPNRGSVLDWAIGGDGLSLPPPARYPVQGELALDPQVEAELAPRAERIRSLVNVARGCFVEIGLELHAARKEIPHGQWLPWLRYSFDWSQSTARRYMQIADGFGKLFTVKNLGEDLTIDARALYALSAPNVPQEVRDRAVEEAEAGKHITEAEAEKLIAQQVAVAQRMHNAQVAELYEKHATEQRLLEEKLRKEHETELHDREDEYLSRIGALKDKVAGLKADLEAEPTIEDAVEMFRQLTGKRKLTARQYQALALALGKPISDGRRIYPPATEAESREAEAQLAGLMQLVRGMEQFETSPDPAQLLRGAPDFAVAAIKRLLAPARQYLDQASAAMGDTL